MRRMEASRSSIPSSCWRETSAMNDPRWPRPGARATPEPRGISRRRGESAHVSRSIAARPARPSERPGRGWGKPAETGRLRGDASGSDAAGDPGPYGEDRPEAIRQPESMRGSTQAGTGRGRRSAGRARATVAPVVAAAVTGPAIAPVGARDPPRSPPEAGPTGVHRCRRDSVADPAAAKSDLRRAERTLEERRPRLSVRRASACRTTCP